MFDKGIARAYASDIHSQWETHYAAWPPGTPLKLGDYGTLKKAIFVKRGNIVKDFGVEIDTAADRNKNLFEYKSSNAVDVKVEVGGSAGTAVPIGKARTTLSFSKKRAIFFKARDCTFNSIENIDGIEKRLQEMADSDEWRKRYVVVTGLVQAGGTTVIIAGGQKASIAIEGSAGIGLPLDLADASLGLKALSENNIGLKIIALKKLTPLIALRRLRGYFEPEFAPAEEAPPEPAPPE